MPSKLALRLVPPGSIGPYNLGMKSAPLHPREAERLAALERLQIMDSPAEKDFDDITLIASQICDTPIALVSLVDQSRQWFKSKKGLTAEQTPRDLAFCAHAILGSEPLVVPDASDDERFADNPLVTGGPKVVFYAGAPLLSPDGLPIGTLCVIDTKPRNLSEAQISALRALSTHISRLLELRVLLDQQKEHAKQLELKKTAIENLSEGVVLQGTDFRIVEFNAAALEVLGLSADQLTGKSSMDPSWRAVKSDGTPFPGLEHPAVVALLTGKPQRLVTMGVHRPNAELRWLEINSTPIFGPDGGKPLWAVTSFRDITETRKAKLTLQKAEANHRRILDGMPSMIAQWSRDLINIGTNNACDIYFGKSPSQIRGQSLISLLGEDTYRKNIPYIEKVLRGEPQTFERMLPTKGGVEIPVMVNYLPETENGAVTGFIAIITDISEIKKLEFERQMMAAQLVESAKMSTLGEMAGGVAHEINTPLAVIITKTSMLVEDLQSGDAKLSDVIPELEKIGLTAERIAKIVKGMRQFSRQSTADPKESISISAVTESTLNLCHEKLLQAQIKVVKEIDESLNVSARFTEISQVLMNLISNATDAVEPLSEKWIKISAIKQDKKAIITVTDSGRGIAQNIWDKIMNPFFTTKELGRGTGLGLSISKGIVESHDGHIFYDEKSANTRFVIELPLTPSANSGGPQ